MTETALASRPEEALSCESDPFATSSASSSSAPSTLFTSSPTDFYSDTSSSSSSATPAYLDYTPGYGDDPDAIECRAPDPASTPAPTPARPPPRRPGSGGNAGSPGDRRAGGTDADASDANAGGPDSAGGGSPSEPADSPGTATADAAAQRPGATGARGGRQRESQAEAGQRRQRDQTLRRLAMPAATAARGVARIGREPLFLNVSQRAWSAPRTLDAPLPEPQAQKTPQQPGPPQAENDPATARQAYAAAAGQAEALFDRILAAAARLAREADGQLQALTDRNESQLGLALDRLEEDHAQRVVDAARARDAVLERIATRSDILRFYVVEQANGALGRMSALREQLLTMATTLGKPVVEAKGALSTAISDANTAGTDAGGALHALSVSRTTEFRNSGKFPVTESRGPAMVAAMIEAAVHYAGPRIQADIKALSDRSLMVQNFAEPIAACGPCEADGKLVGLRSQADSLGVAGPRAIRSARDGALKSIDQTEQQLNLSVVESHRQAEDGLVTNHDQTRQMLIAQSAQATRGLGRDIERTGRQQVDMLTGIAATQPAAVAMVEREVDKAARTAPTRATALAVQSVTRLRRNLANVSERHPSGVLGMADRNRASRMDRATAGGREMLAMVATFAEQQRKFIGETSDMVGQSIDQTLFDMAGVPGQVGKSCDSMIAAAQAAVTAAETEIPPQMAFIALKLTDACDGLIPMSPDSPPANPDAAANNEAAPTEPLMCTPEDEPNMSVFDPGATSSPMMSVAPPASSGGAMSSDSGGTGTGSSRGGGTPAPPPASCGNCDTARTAARDRATAAAPPDATGEGAATTTTSDAGDDVGVSSDRTNQRSPNAYREHAAPIGTDATKAPTVAAFLTQVVSAVETKLGSQADTAWTALKKNAATDYPSLMDAFRGMNKTQGAALSEAYKNQKGKDLAQQIKDHAKFGGSTRRTKEKNRDAALAALDGDINGSALNELEAAFNWSNETDRIFRTMQAMSRDQMRSFVAANRGRLNELMEQLSDADQARFQLLMDVNTVRARSTELKNNVDAVNRRHMSGRASDERGFALGDAFRDAEHAQRWALEGPSDRVDIYELEDTTVRQAREAEHWADIQRDVGNLDGVADAIMRDNPSAAVSRPDDPPGAMLLAYATRPLTLYNVIQPHQRQGESREDALARQDREYREHFNVTIEERSDQRGSYRVATTSMNEYQLHALEQSIRFGARSREARGARALAQFRRSDGRPADYKDVEAQLHSGIADAREGGNFEHGSREEADRDRLETFRMMEQHRRQIEGGASGPISGEAARDSFRREMAADYRDRPQDLDVALGVIDSDEGNMQAVIDQAIAREDPALLNRYLGRMDSRQIETLVTEWNRRHPSGPGLRERLGVGRDNHWTWTNWNGAAFTGDEANTLELAMMGVPQTPQQKGELALRIVDQQIEQAGWMGRLLCDDEYTKLTEHARHLRETMGVTEGDVDGNGRIRMRTRDGEVFYGSFGRDGQFRPEAGGNSTALNMLSAGSRIVADNYANAVDRMASMITTVIAVIGAIILTVATFGAGASVLVAMAIAAGIGALTIGVNASMRGGRYSRDDLTRDVVSAAVQIATAGLNVGIARGLAAGAKVAQGGAAAVRAASLSSRLAATASRHALATGMITQGAMGGMSNLASTALDPAMRRRDDYGDQVMHSFFRGVAGGAVTAGVAHGLNTGASRLVQRLAVNRAVNAAMAQGASRAVAIERAAEAAVKASRGRFMDYGVRAFVGATSATAGRATEMGYENAAGIRQHSGADFYRELRHSFIQNAIQGIGEGGALRATRGRVASHVTRQVELDDGERRSAADAAGAAFDREMARLGVTPPQPETVPGERPPAAPRAADEDEGPAVRTADEEGRRRPPVAANDDDAPPGAAPVRARIALAEGEMLRMGRVAEGSVLIHPETTNLHAANDNFGRLVNADPTREVAVYHNPVTGEYLVIQGVERSVAMIRHDGEIKGPGISGFPAAALAQRGGRWELRTHFHPNRPGQTHTNMARRLPSGQNGDLGVVEAEARHIALLSEDGVGERTSRIYFVDEGKLRYTDFSVRIDGDNVTYRVSFPNPATGAHGEPKVFTDIAAYHTFFEQQTGIRYPVPTRRGARGRTADSPPETPLDPARRVGGETAGLDDALTQQNRIDAAFVAQRMGQAESFKAARHAGRTHESGIDPLLGRLASTVDAHRMVSDMGLVDRPDSMRRLSAIINDRTLGNAVKERVLTAVREATREALIRRGALEPHEPLLLTLHGAPDDRSGNIRRGGIDLSLVERKASDDFAHALYFSTQLHNAQTYARRGRGTGHIFPGILRGRDMGMEVTRHGTRPGSTIDVTAQGAHRAQWEAFVRANMDLLGQAEGMASPERGRRMIEQTMEIGRQVFAENPANAGRTPTQRELFQLGSEHFVARAPFADLDRFGTRAVLFDAFVRHMAETTGDTRLGAPHIVLGELGGVLTSGFGHGDQQAIKSQRIADILNDQLGVPRPGARADGDEGSSLRVRAVDEPDAAEGAAARRTAEEREFDRQIERAFRQMQSDADARGDTGKRPGQPARILPEGWTLIRNTIGVAARGNSPEAVHLRALLAGAPDATRRILHEIATQSLAGRRRTITDYDVFAIEAELMTGGMSRAQARNVASNIAMVASPATRLHQTLSEVPFTRALQSSLRQPLERATAERSGVRAARDFADRNSPTPERRELRRLLDVDTEGMVRMITGEGSWQSRAMSFAWRRFRQGVGWSAALRDGFLAARILRSPAFATTQAQWQARATVLTPRLLAAMIRARPDALHHLARTSPQQLSEWFADYVLRQPRSTPPVIDPDSFASYVNNRMISNVLPIVSEASSVWSNFRRLGLQLLKADAVQRGGANRPGLDLVGFSVTPGTRPGAGDMVRVVIIDDKAYRGTDLENVSAMTGLRLITNLRTTAAEIDAGVLALRRLGEHVDNPQIAEYMAGARAATRQMRNAANELAAISPPGTDMRNRAYLRRVAEILRRNNIVPLVSSEYGNVRNLANWLRAQGFRLDDEYARILAEELLANQRRTGTRP